MEYTKYKSALLKNKDVCDVIANGDLSIQTCIDGLQKLGYRILKINTIEAFGLTTKVWTYHKKHGYGCDECCNKDRCNHGANHHYRPDCPHCKGKGWIKEDEVKIAIYKY